MTEFTQWTNSKRLYHLDLESVDGSDFPHSKPTWTLAQFNADGSPGQVGTLETPPDLHTNHDRALAGKNRRNRSSGDVADGGRFANFYNQRRSPPAGRGTFADVSDFSPQEWSHPSIRR